MPNRIGTPGDDKLFLFEGDGLDGVRGADGNDTIENFNVTAGRPDLRGGNGDDVIIAGEGGDRLAGADGNDVLIGDVSSNVATGGIGDDMVSGGLGDDSLEGNIGNDVVGGFSDVIDVFGDTMFGPGFDLTSGGNGADTLTGGIGDTLVGGTGRDLFRLDPGRVTDRLPVIVDLGPGQDRIEFLRLPDLDPDTVLRIKAVAFGDVGSGVALVCHVIAQDALGEQTFLGQFGLATFPNVFKFGFLNNIEIVNNDAPLL